LNPLLKHHTRYEIAETCGVSYRTVLNWIKLETIPLWAIKKLGFTLRGHDTH